MLKVTLLFGFVLFTFVPTVCFASNQDLTGTTLLFATTTNLNGSGIRVGQAEDELTTGGNDWEVSATNIGHPAGFITYYTNTSTSVFPNSLGAESFHGRVVASNFCGIPGGMATNVSHLDNYEATYFIDVTLPGLHTINNDRILNQSFSFGQLPLATQQQYDREYDNFAVQNNVLIVSAAGNAGQVSLPATCYNGISVGVIPVNGSSYGPTPDNGRAKPEIFAPEGATSYATPEVAGAAALLMQAAFRGDGGSDTNSAGDYRMTKALLINGAIKPANWSAPSPSPLDPTNGAGTLNVFNSYRQLTGGKHAYTTNALFNLTNSHVPFSTTNSLAITNLNGWHLVGITSSVTKDAVNEYHFTLPNNTNNLGNSMNMATYTATITLDWNRQVSKTAINNLYLYLYRLSPQTLMAASTSVVDNIQHIYVQNLPAGDYALQVYKPGGSGEVSTGETYALAWEFFNQTLTISKNTDGNLLLKWPVYPTGFVVESSPDLSPLSWSGQSFTPSVISNTWNQVLVTPPAGGNIYYRLRRP
jgi:hypothetical protein